MSESITLEIGDIHYQMYQQLEAIAGEDEIGQNIRTLLENEIHQAFQEVQQQQDQQIAEMEQQQTEEPVAQDSDSLSETDD